MVGGRCVLQLLLRLMLPPRLPPPPPLLLLAAADTQPTSHGHSRRINHLQQADPSVRVPANLFAIDVARVRGSLL
jgi:hypothetical protein